MGGQERKKAGKMKGRQEKGGKEGEIERKRGEEKKRKEKKKEGGGWV